MIRTYIILLMIIIVFWIWIDFDAYWVKFMAGGYLFATLPALYLHIEYLKANKNVSYQISEKEIVIDKVRELRMKAGVSQVNLSVNMGLNAKFVGNVESNKTPDKYNLNHLNKIAAILDHSIKDFFPDQPITNENAKEN